ncbi:hypothetical protein [Streptomyces sp. NPDC019937]|uniref:hypothetical protein n=1 Tax=Streptomyces sp. NPDC019937 TaxID=3154787 RepID=UPI0033C33980
MGALMNYFRSQHVQHAFAEVRANDLLRFLKARGIEVTAETRERIESCKDMDVLGTWLDRAGTVSRAEELFADG